MRDRAHPDERDLHASLYRFVARRIDDRCESSDLVQEAFARLYAYRRRTPVDDAAGFCFTVVRNLLRDRFRQRQRAPVTTGLTEELVCPQPLADEVLLHRQRVAILSKAIEGMPALRREVFLRRRLDGRSTDDVSRDLGLSTAAVEKHVTRALADLRRALARRDLRTDGRA